MIIHTSEIAISRLPHVQPDSSFALRDLAHMVLAGGPFQTLYNLSTGMHQRAVDFVCREAAGAIAEDYRGRPYFAMDGNQRMNETLGIFAVAGVRFDRTPIQTVRQNKGTLGDVAQTAMETIRDDSREKSWSLMLFAVHPGVTAEWHNESGELQSVEKILASEIRMPHGSGCCFGTHRLEGIAFAIRRFCLEHDVEPSKLNGVWSDAYQYFLEALDLIKRNQLEDGSLQRAWFRKKRFPLSGLELRETLQDVVAFRDRDAALVYATGHCLDAISPLSELLREEQEWIQQACYILAQTIDSRWTSVGRNVRSLTHAIHALKLLDV